MRVDIEYVSKLDFCAFGYPLHLFDQLSRVLAAVLERRLEVPPARVVRLRAHLLSHGAALSERVRSPAARRVLLGGLGRAPSERPLHLRIIVDTQGRSP